MEKLTVAEAAPKVSYEQLAAMPDEELASIGPKEATDLLSGLEKPDDQMLFNQAFRLRELLWAAGESDNTRDIDRAVAAAVRLGLVETSPDQLDQVFDGPEIILRTISDPEHPELKKTAYKDYAKTEIDRLRWRRTELFEKDLDQWIDREIESTPESGTLTPVDRAEAARRMIAAHEARDASVTEHQREAARTGMTEKDYAHEQALAMDRQAKLMAESPELQNYERLIAEARDFKIKAALDKERLAYIQELRAKADDISLKAGIAAGELRAAARERNEIDPRRIPSPENKDFIEERALAMREALGIPKSARPDWTEKKGGLFHRKAGRGPKIIEEGYVDPNNPHIMVVERRLRRTGELISQVALNTRRPAEARGMKQDYQVRFIPPRSIGPRLERERQHDKLSPQLHTTWADYVAGWGDYKPGELGKSYDVKKKQLRRSRSWLAALFGI